jgi:hypothetical protein
VTKVLVSKTAAKTIFDEVQRWVEHGLTEGGSALESLLYPLSAMVPHDKRIMTPLELVANSDIAELVIDDAAIPPDEIKAFSPGNCHFSGDIEHANQVFNQQIDALIARAPRMGVHSKLHTHPFEGGAFLSGGDMHHGVLAAKAVAWRQRQGLQTAILHVVHPDGPPRKAKGKWRIDKQGALAMGEDGSRVHWRIRSWLSFVDQRGGGALEMRDVGDADIVSTRHDSVRAVRRKTYYQTRRGARWCDAQKAALRAAGFSVSRNLMGRGWRRYLISTEVDQLLIGLPPDFPQLSPRVLRVRRAWCNDFEPLELPVAWKTPSYSLSLVALTRHYASISAALPVRKQPVAPAASSLEAGA